MKCQCVCTVAQIHCYFCTHASWLNAASAVLTRVIVLAIFHCINAASHVVGHALIWSSLGRLDLDGGRAPLLHHRPPAAQEVHHLEHADEAEPAAEEWRNRKGDEFWKEGDETTLKPMEVIGLRNYYKLGRKGKRSYFSCLLLFSPIWHPCQGLFFSWSSWCLVTGKKFNQIRSISRK